MASTTEHDTDEIAGYIGRARKAQQGIEDYSQEQADDCVPQAHGQFIANKTDRVKAIRKMRVGPSGPVFRNRFQTTPSCCD